LRELRRNQSGSAVVITAASMPLLIGAAGMAADTIQWTLWKRQLQRAADTGAVAGAYALGQGKTVSTAATAAIGKDADIGMNTPTVENAPTSGSYAGNAKAVRVIVTASHRLPFTGMFIPTPTITAEATAAILTNGNHCVIALDKSTATGISMAGNATVNLGCGMAANSMGSSAIDASGSTSITATPVTAVGGITGTYSSSTVKQPYSLPQPDPFEALPTPASGDFTGCSNEVKVNPSDSATTLTPGCYKGLDLNGTVTLSPGTYFIDGSTNKDFSIGAQANVSGTGVTIILTSSNAVSNPGSIATMSINGGATINLTAPTSGTYTGVLFYQDRRATYETNGVVINGNSGSKLQGAAYFPQQKIKFLGTAGMNTDCVQIVGFQVEFSGDSAINNNCPVGSNTQSFIGSVVRLVA
jgi:Flp pilus assembly protein TadG